MPLSVGFSLLSQERHQITGTARYVQELLVNLTQEDRGVRVTVAGHDNAIESLRERMGSFGTAVTVAGGQSTSRFGRAAGLALRGLRRSDPSQAYFAGMDVVHFPLTLRIPKPNGPHVVTLHDLLHHEHPKDFTRLQHLWRSVYYDRGTRAADQVITVSNHARGVIIEQLGIPEERVHAIHHGINHEQFSAGEHADDLQLSQELGLPARYVFFPASLWPHKNHARLIESLAAARIPELKLVLSGATFGQLDALREVARRHDFDDQLLHLGYVSNAALPTVYRRATATVFPSLYEGFGIPPLEAMACGCPVASSFGGSLGEVCGDAAVELKPTDVEQMTEAITRIVNDTALRDTLRTRGLERSVQFSWERCAEQHVSVYRLAGLALTRSWTSASTANPPGWCEHE